MGNLDTARPDVSIVVPLYDEEENVAPLCAAVREALEDQSFRYELLLVDDGSRDGTRTILREEAKRDPRIRALFLRRNSGQTAAMATGFARARGRIVVSMDGDLQNDPRDIPALLSKLEEGFDVVCGWRKNRQDPFLSRTLPSRLANSLIAWITGIPIHDNGCSLKAYRAEVVRSLRLYSEMHRYIPALAAMTGARIAEVVVRHHPRLRGKSKYGITRTFKVLGDIIVVKMLTGFANRPGRWFVVLALPWLALGLLAAGAWVRDLWSSDRTSSIVYPGLAMMFLYMFGHLMSLSIVSEMFLACSDRRLFDRLEEALVVRRD